MLTPYESGKYRVTSAYGYRTHPVTGEAMSFHGGVDLVGDYGKNIVAVKGGTVAFAGCVNDRASGGATWQWGNYVRIDQSDGFKIYYCHLSKACVKAGDKVNAGDIIGVEGATGQVTGSHLHFEVRYNQSVKKQFNAADYLGIANIIGTRVDMPSRADVYAAIASKCNFSDKAQAIAAMKSVAHPYPYDFWGKIYDALG